MIIKLLTHILLYFKNARAKDVSDDFNIHKTSKINFAKQTKIKSINIEENVQIDYFKGFLDELSIKKNTYIWGELRVYGYNGTLQIGKYCSLSGRLVIMAGEGFHHSKRLSTYPFSFKSPYNKFNFKKDFYNIDSFPKYKVKIGNDVWIGEDVVLSKNVKIGDGAIIAAKSVIIFDVPDYAIVLGNPANIIGYRHKKDVIELIKKIQWWNWSDEKIVKNIDIFKLSGDDLNSKLNDICVRNDY